MNNELIINELLEIEAWAEGLREKSRKTRMMLQGVSTPCVPRGNEKNVAAVLTKRKHFIKNRKARVAVTARA
jgi:hypothetical protein